MSAQSSRSTMTHGDIGWNILHCCARMESATRIRFVHSLGPYGLSRNSLSQRGYRCIHIYKYIKRDSYIHIYIVKFMCIYICLHICMFFNMWSYIATEAHGHRGTEAEAHRQRDTEARRYPWMFICLCAANHLCLCAFVSLFLCTAVPRCCCAPVPLRV